MLYQHPLINRLTPTVVNSRPIIYEHPLNDRIRTLLRLEHLFRQAQNFQKGASSWDSRMVITTLFDILDLFSRSDLKTEIIKEGMVLAIEVMYSMGKPEVVIDKDERKNYIYIWFF